MSEEGAKKARMVVAGNDRLVMPLVAVGFEPSRCGSAPELAKALGELAQREDVALVVCGEGQAERVPEAIEEFRKSSPGLLLVVPDSSEAKRLDASVLRTALERAAGVDLLGKALGKKR